jgi:16S rRNA (cytidine1402-2'-O)-methyltransferase
MKEQQGRYLKTLAKEIVIDNYEWFTMAVDDDTAKTFRKKINEGKTIGIISEAGCPGIADPWSAVGRNST